MKRSGIARTAVILPMFYEQIAQELEELKTTGSRFRRLTTLQHACSDRIVRDGRELLNLSSNDYLGLAGNRELIEQFYADRSTVDRLRPGSTSSRLLTGNHAGYEELELLLAERYRRQASLVFSSGYHANLGVLSSLAGRDDLILCDKLCHASIIDGAILSRAKMHRYRHGDMEHLTELLERHTAAHRRTLIVTESVFSMDGDRCDLPALVQLKKKYGAALVVDEAHAVGVLGPTCLGLAEQEDLISQVDLIVGTFGKALAGHGAYVICDQLTRDYLINKARQLIFTTALPPVIVEWNRMIVDRLPQFHQRAVKLQDTARQFRHLLEAANITTRGDTQIVPAILGENEAAVEASKALESAGYLSLPIRPPTVPQGTARLRFSLTAGMDIDMLMPIVEIVGSRQWAVDSGDDTTQGD